MHKQTLSNLLFILSLTVSEGQTVVAIRGPQFTLNGQPTYTAASGFRSADPNLQGVLLNVRAVQAIFDDANYPNGGSRAHPYPSSLVGDISFDYPGGPWDPERNVREFLAALPEWRRCGVLAITVNLQGGGPSDGNSTRQYLNSGFDPHGALKPAYADRLRRVIEEADRLGMVVIVGFFYSGSNERIAAGPEDRYAKEALRQASLFLKNLPHRNILIEIENEVSAGFSHPIMQPDGILDAVLLAQKTVERQIPVSMSWIRAAMPRDARVDAAMRAADYVMFHTNRKTPDEVHSDIQAMRRWAGDDRPIMINEDGVSTFNLQAAVQEHVGWGYYDQGLGNYHDGFQSPPVSWRIDTLTKWVFFEQAARLTGSPPPPRPVDADATSPVIHTAGLAAGQTLKQPTRIEAVIADRDSRWPIKRVEFFIDNKPYSYELKAPYVLNGQEQWDMRDVTAGKHELRVVAYDQRGPAFSEVCSILDIPFAIER